MRLFCILLLVGFTVLASQNWFEHQAALQQAATLHNAHCTGEHVLPATMPPWLSRTHPTNQRSTPTALSKGGAPKHIDPSAIESPRLCHRTPP